VPIASLENAGDDRRDGGEPEGKRGRGQEAAATEPAPAMRAPGQALGMARRGPSCFGLLGHPEKRSW
jgi:hypothetical protein